MPRMIVYAAAVLVTAAACDSTDLRSERAAYRRLEEQRATYQRDWKACEVKHGVERLFAAWQAARERYDRASAAVWQVTTPSAGALTEQQEAGAARDRAFEAWNAAVKECGPCASEAEAELNIRRAEYLAACRKCGVDERCVANANAGAWGLGKLSRLACESSAR